MKNLTLRICSSLLLLASLTSSYALPATSLQELMQRVVKGSQADQKINQQRLLAFTQGRDQQAALLRQSNEKMQDLERLGKQITGDIAAKDREITALEEQLKSRLGNFGELFGVTRQVADDTRAQIHDSLISAQYPNRAEALADIAQSKTLPTLEQLRMLWIVLLQEQTEQGQVARFDATVSDSEGMDSVVSALRLGPFTAVSEQGFLVFDAKQQQLKQLAKQPSSIHLHAATNMFNARQGELIKASLDPSSGTILGLLVQTPSLLDRFHQGGLPGYVVTVLAIIGLSIGFVRLLVLWITELRVKTQKNNNHYKTNNPLGRVLKTYDDNAGLEYEALELKLDDAVLKEIPRLDQGLNTLKVLAAVAPLIGLLGTVLGMILTFQAITLWGTGEPKLMAGGISQALVTTVQGLVAAIPLLLLHSFANTKARNLQQVLEEQCAGLIAKRAEQAHG